ncbi:carbohydrate ABC transporter permease [Bifidobacterium amazonense]|uniref:Carbohydrate ABC transporter permease n=1 Tax=Bifidobacterium amazonense TaxID=2809027 RepID=A0ABS9VXA1_9BIFI|nr:carbohydrate ABC transporter permease [Bifidobacterium amazonense]MCH9276536.1 carbohydrate ABC transporter permease [Bifidobacterium amazonense]
MTTIARPVITRQNLKIRSGQRIVLSHGWARILTMLLFAVAFVYFVVPVCWLFVASTKSAGDLYTTPSFAFAEFRLFENISSLFAYQNGVYLRWIANSILYSVIGSLLTVLVSAMCGYGLAVYQFRGRRIILGAVMVSFLVPGAALTQPLYLQLVRMGLNNNILGVILPALVYPFGVMFSWLTVRASVPMEIIEAARVDGAGEIRTFFQIVMPMMRVGLTTVFLFTFMGSWNNYMLPMMILDDPELYPLAVGLVDWNKQSTSVAQLGTLTLVGSFVSLMPLILVFIFSQRYWKSGIAAGGVKM